MKNCKIYLEKYLKVFFWILLIGLFAHLFMLTNKLVNHDDLSALFGKGTTYEVGRWGLRITQYILPNISMPFFHGMMTLIFIAITACIVSEIFNIEDKKFQILIGGIMITFPSIIGTFSYMFTVSSYAVAIMLSVLSVYCIAKERNLWYYILGISLLIFSLSIYQAYISITASLLIIILIKDCLNKEKTLKAIIINALKYLSFLIISLLTYYFITSAINQIKGIELSFYQNVNEMEKIRIESILKGIGNSYTAMYKILFENWMGIAYNNVLRILYIIIVVIDIGIILIIANRVRRQCEITKGILVLIFALLLPITMNMIYIINPNGNMHALIVYGNIIIFILPFLLFEKIKDLKKLNWIRNVLLISLFLVIYQYCVLANECYMRLHITYENTFAFYNTLSTRIQETDGFNKNIKIALIGNFKNNLITNTDTKFKNTRYVAGIKNTQQLINCEPRKRFLEYYIGVDFEYASENEISFIKQLPEYKEMNVYPYDNSIKMIDNIIIVKCE